MPEAAAAQSIVPVETVAAFAGSISDWFSSPTNSGMVKIMLAIAKIEINLRLNCCTDVTPNLALN
jgi:hypothetical protein